MGDAPGLCMLSQASASLRVLADDNVYWESLYADRFGDVVQQQHTNSSTWSLRSMKTHYAVAHMQGVRAPSRGDVLERDCEQGPRFIIHDSFLATLPHLLHVPLVPFKALGLLCFPIYQLLRLRYGSR